MKYKNKRKNKKLREQFAELFDNIKDYQSEVIAFYNKKTPNPEGWRIEINYQYRTGWAKLDIFDNRGYRQYQITPFFDTVENLNKCFFEIVQVIKLNTVNQSNHI